MDLFGYTRLTDAFERAMAEAFRLHRAQERKGSRVPYLGHLLGTAGLVLHFGGTEEQAIGALLHDAAEDCGGRPVLDHLRAEFGPAVADIVEGCTDTFETPRPDWRPRKEAYVRSIATKPTATLLVSAADKLDNARAIVADLRVHGEETWERFSAGRDVLWYYTSLVEAFAARGIGPIAHELAAAVATMEFLAGSDPAAPRPATVHPRLVELLVEHSRLCAGFAGARDGAEVERRAPAFGRPADTRALAIRLRALDAVGPLSVVVLRVLRTTDRAVEYAERCRRLLRASAEATGPGEAAAAADAARELLRDDEEWSALQAGAQGAAAKVTEGFDALVDGLLERPRT